MEDIYKIIIMLSENMEGDEDGEDDASDEHDEGGEEDGDVEIDNDEEDGDLGINEDDEENGDIVVDEDEEEEYGADSFNDGGGAGFLGQHNEERRMVDEWTRYGGCLNCVEFWYYNSVRTWKREYGLKTFGEWKTSLGPTDADY